MNNVAQKLKITRQLPHDRARVFSALTDPAKMTQWFCGMKNGTAKVTSDSRPGGKYKVEMTDGEKSGVSEGAYLEVVPPSKIVMTWGSTCGGSDSILTFDLVEHEGGTQLILTHELPEEAIEAHKNGWGVCLDNLEGYLGGRNRVTPPAQV